MATKERSYQIQAKLDLLVAIEVSAKSLEEALQKSSNLKETDFVEINGDYIDGNYRITGVYES